jgi:hypothetical protein
MRKKCEREKIDALVNWRGGKENNIREREKEP